MFMKIARTFRTMPNARAAGRVPLLSALATMLAVAVMLTHAPRAFAQTTCSTTCYVDAASGNDANDGVGTTSALRTIGRAVQLASSGATIYVAAGTYSENVVVTKSLTLLGAQAGVTATGTTRSGGESILNGTGGSSSFVVHVQANDVTIDGFAINPRINPSNSAQFARDAINVRVDHVAKTGDATIGAYRKGIVIRNNWIYSNIGALTGQQQGLTFGESPNNNSPSAPLNAEVANVTITGNYIAMVNTASSGGPRGIVLGNQFQGTLTSGGKASILYTNWLVDGNVVYASNIPFFQSQLQTRLSGMTITNNTFGNSRSGVSIAATMENSAFNGNIVQDVSAGSGATLCLVNSTASGNTIRRVAGSGLVLSGGRSTDATYFAPTSNATVTSNTITYNDVAVAAGTTYVAGVNVQPNLDGTGVSIAGTKGAEAGSITLAGNIFTNGGYSATLPAMAIAQRSVSTTLNLTTGAPNVFNGVELRGASTVSEALAIADQVMDAVDATNLGAVRLRVGAVYVTPSSYFSPTTSGSIQRGIDAASAGDVVYVAPGVYTENVTLNKAVTVRGPNAGVSGASAGRDAATGAGEATIVGMVKATSAGSVTVEGMRFLASVGSGVNGASNPSLQRQAGSAGGTHVYANNIFYSTQTASTNTSRAIALETLGSGTTVVRGNYITGNQTGKYGTSSWDRGIWSDGGGVSSIRIEGNVLQYVRTGINVDVAGEATFELIDNELRSAGTGVSGGLNAAGQVGNIRGMYVENVDTTFNFQNLSAAVAFEAGQAIAVTTPATQTIVVLGGSAADVLTGTANVDVMYGRAGDDEQRGAGLCGADSGGVRRKRDGAGSSCCDGAGRGLGERRNSTVAE